MPQVAIYTGSVEIGPSIDLRSLHLLATVLCDEDSYHDLVFQQSCLALTEETCEREREANGGYCNRCMSHAGFILSRFDISERTDLEASLSEVPDGC
jgi:hypothetical protein